MSVIRAEFLADFLMNNAALKKSLSDAGLTVLDRTWEDTGRAHYSCYGPNITDQTLRANGRNMPVIRPPVYRDPTFDASIDKFTVLVGNEDLYNKDGPLTRISLKEYLEHFSKYNAGNDSCLLLERDSKLLVSSQACILPSTKGKTEFELSFFNHQTSKEHPTLLVIISSPQGTSTLLVNERSSQVVRFNHHGRAHNFEVQRLEDDRKQRGVSTKNKFALSPEELERNALIVFHIPLEQPPPPPATRTTPTYTGFGSYTLPPQCAIAYLDNKKYGEVEHDAPDSDDEWRSLSIFDEPAVPAARGFDAGVLSVGTKDLGAFPSIYAGKTLKRDATLPIRAVIQSYVCSDSDQVSNDALQFIIAKVLKPYQTASDQDKGSLVVDEPKGRITEMKPKAIPAGFSAVGLL